MPHVAYTPTDWAEQLHFWRRCKACDFTRAGRPAAGGDRVGSSTNRAELIRQLVLAGPPAWA